MMNSSRPSWMPVTKTASPLTCEGPVKTSTCFWYIVMISSLIVIYGLVSLSSQVHSNAHILAVYHRLGTEYLCNS